MKNLTRRNLLGLALAGLAGCKCVSTDKSMDLPLLGNVKPYPVPVFHIVKLSRDRNYFRPFDDKNFFTLDSNGHIIFHKGNERVFIPTYKGEHDYKSLFDCVRMDLSNHAGRFYEIINMDTGEGGLLYA